MWDDDETMTFFDFAAQTLPPAAGTRVPDERLRLSQDGYSPWRRRCRETTEQPALDTIMQNS
jgi:hypothetical protein